MKQPLEALLEEYSATHPANHQSKRRRNSEVEKSNHSFSTHDVGSRVHALKKGLVR